MLTAELPSEGMGAGEGKSVSKPDYPWVLKTGSLHSTPRGRQKDVARGFLKVMTPELSLQGGPRVSGSETGKAVSAKKAAVAGRSGPDQPTDGEATAGVSAWLRPGSRGSTWRGSHHQMLDCCLEDGLEREIKGGCC